MSVHLLNPDAVRGHNSPPPDEDEAVFETVEIEVAELVERAVYAIAAATGHHRDSKRVMKKKQALDVLSLRQLSVYCLTHENEDLAIVPIVRLAKIMGFDRGTVRDDRKAVEDAAEADPDLQDYLDTVRELVLAVPTIAKGTQTFFLSMDISRSRSKTRIRRLREAKRKFDKSMERLTRGQTALIEVGRQDLADHQGELLRKKPYNPLTDGRLAHLCRN